MKALVNFCVENILRILIVVYLIVISPIILAYVIYVSLFVNKDFASFKKFPLIN